MLDRSAICQSFGFSSHGLVQRLPPLQDIEHTYTLHDFCLISPKSKVYSDRSQKMVKGQLGIIMRTCMYILDIF